MTTKKPSSEHNEPFGTKWLQNLVKFKNSQGAKFSGHSLQPKNSRDHNFQKSRKENDDSKNANNKNCGVTSFEGLMMVSFLGFPAKEGWLQNNCCPLLEQPVAVVAAAAVAAVVAHDTKKS